MLARPAASYYMPFSPAAESIFEQLICSNSSLEKTKSPPLISELVTCRQQQNEAPRMRSAVTAEASGQGNAMSEDASWALRNSSAMSHVACLTP